MRSFIGDEAFEPVAAPADDRPKPASTYEPPPAITRGLKALEAAAPALDVAGKVLWAFQKGQKAEESFEKTGDSGNLMPVIRVVWSVIPERFHRPVLRVVCGLGGLVFALLALAAGSGLPWLAAIFAIPTAALLGYAVAPAFVVGTAARVRQAVADRLMKAEDRLDARAEAAEARLEAAARRPPTSPGAVAARGWIGLRDAPGGLVTLVVLAFLAFALAVFAVTRGDLSGAWPIALAGLGFIAALVLFYVTPGPRRVLTGLWTRLTSPFRSEFALPGFVGLMLVAAGVAILVMGRGLLWGLGFAGAGALSVAVAVSGTLGKRRMAAAERAGDALADAEAAPPGPPPPPLRLEVYWKAELPPLPLAYAAPVTDAHNIVGLPPERIVWLDLLFAPNDPADALAFALCRFGPVQAASRLSGPGEALSARTGGTLIKTAEALDRRRAAMSAAAMPPGDPALTTSVNYLSGAYGTERFDCAEPVWRRAVTALVADAGRVVVNLRGARAAAPAAQWELRELIDRVRAEHIVVLLDPDSDQAALCAAFRSAWAGMSADSPNRRGGANPLRWVVLEAARPPGSSSDAAPAEGSSSPDPQVPPPNFDPQGLRAKVFALAQMNFDCAYGRAVDEDRVCGLLLAPQPRPRARAAGARAAKPSRPTRRSDSPTPP